jgi:hypothetical protein
MSLLVFNKTQTHEAVGRRANGEEGLVERPDPPHVRTNAVCRRAAPIVKRDLIMLPDCSAGSRHQHLSAMPCRVNRDKSVDINTYQLLSPSQSERR